MSKQQPVELTTEAEIQAPVQSWGASLRETRIKRGLSVADISKTLHFETKLIESIEAEELEQLPSASFVKGYLRSYSRLLDMDAEPLVRSYGQVCGDEASIISKVVQVNEVSSKDAGPRYATWLVVAILAISLVVWWRAEILLPSAVNKDTLETAIETMIVDSSAPDVVASPETEEPVLAAPAAVVEEAVPEPMPQFSTLVLRFADDSWVEINDAQGTRLYMDVAKAGQTKTVAGEPPFKMLFGNASAVILEYNGEVYDHSKHNSKGVARFSLGE